MAERSDYIRRRAERLTKRMALSQPPPSEPLDLVIRQTYEKTHVLFLTLQALQVQVQELRAETTALRSVVLTFISNDPQVREDASAVIRKFIQERTQ